MNDLDPWESDTRDDAEAFVTLDGCDIAVCPKCDHVTYQCKCCAHCGGVEPCDCCVPFSQAEERASRDRFYGGRTWRS